MNFTRRDLSKLLPALAAAGAAVADDQKGLPARAYKYEDLPVKINPQNHNESRAVLRGPIHTGMPLEVHMTKLAPGQAPHPPHTHVHEELLMLRSGVLDVTFNDKTTRVTPGSVVYAASGILHGWKNPGPEPAEYFIVELGPASA